MKCIECGKAEFICEKVSHSVKVREEPVVVVVPTYICKICGLYILSDEQMNGFRKAAVDAYRLKHDLLTSQDLVEFRKSLGMSPKAFAAHLNMEESFLKGLETYFIQDRYQDDYIRKHLHSFLTENHVLI